MIEILYRIGPNKNLVFEWKCSLSSARVGLFVNNERPAQQRERRFRCTVRALASSLLFVLLIVVAGSLEIPNDAFPWVGGLVQCGRRKDDIDFLGRCQYQWEQLTTAGCCVLLFWSFDALELMRELATVTTALAM